MLYSICPVLDRADGLTYWPGRANLLQIAVPDRIGGASASKSVRHAAAHIAFFDLGLGLRAREAPTAGMRAERGTRGTHGDTLVQRR